MINSERVMTSLSHSYDSLPVSRSSHPGPPPDRKSRGPGLRPSFDRIYCSKFEMLKNHLKFVSESSFISHWNLKIFVAFNQIWTWTLFATSSSNYWYPRWLPSQAKHYLLQTSVSDGGWDMKPMTEKSPSLIDLTSSPPNRQRPILICPDHFREHLCFWIIFHQIFFKK